MKNKVLILLFEDICVDARVQRQYEVFDNFADVFLVAFNNKNYLHNNELFFSMGKEGSLLKSYLKFLKKIKLFTGFDFLVCNNVQSIIPSLLIKLFSPKTKIIYDSHELIIKDPETGLSKASRKSLFLEKMIVKLSDGIIVPNEDRASLMKKYYSLSQTPCVIPNLLESKFSESCNNDKFDEFTYIYQGVLNDNRFLIEIVESFRYVDKAKLIIVGFGKLSGYMSQICNAPDLKGKVEFIPGLSRDELYKVTKQCHVGIVSYDFSSLNNKYCASNKISEYVLLGLPVLATPQLTLKKDLYEFNVGESFNRVDLESANLKCIAQSFVNMKENYDVYLDGVKNNKDNFMFLSEKYSDVIFNRYIN
ncbi:hypothetical protein [Vibrio owensii]|uniref:hypothetical protein n=1 Tax=Vibrio owensii TaxID=696485 RepID=UPI002FF041D9